MDYKSFAVCGARKGSVNWKITDTHLKQHDNNNSEEVSTFRFR